MASDVLGRVDMCSGRCAHARVAALNWRSPPLLKAVRGMPCQNCGRDDGTVCAAHSNQLRDQKGRGIKSHDFRIAALCHTCHHEIDAGNKLTKDERHAIWELAHRKTLGELFERGLVKVA